MIRIDYQCGTMRIDRVDVDQRGGDGCYLLVYYAGKPPSAGWMAVPLDRGQALKLAGELVSISDELGPGMVDRHRNGTTFAYRMKR